MTDFGGIPIAALDFYDDLEADNSKAFWTAHKQIYDEQVRRPIEQVAKALEPEFGAAKIFRPYRDVRFAKDKTPYKTHQGAVVEGSSGAALYFHVDAAGLFVGAGMWRFAPDQTANFRRAVDDDVPGAALERVMAELDRAQWARGGDRLTRAPSGYAKDHPRTQLLRYKALTASRSLSCPAWLDSPAVVDHIAALWRELAPLNQWLAQHVGAADASGANHR